MCKADLALQRHDPAAATQVRSGAGGSCVPLRRPAGYGRAAITPFDIVVVKTRWVAVVQVCGELDLSTAPQLYEQLVSLADEGVLDVTVDLTGLDFIDSSGLHALLAGLKEMRQHGGDLELRSPRPRTRKVLESRGLTSVFRLEPIESAGLAAPSSGPGGHVAQPR